MHAPGSAFLMIKGGAVILKIIWNWNLEFDPPHRIYWSFWLLIWKHLYNKLWFEPVILLDSMWGTRDQMTILRRVRYRLHYEPIFLRFEGEKKDVTILLRYFVSWGMQSHKIASRLQISQADLNRHATEKHDFSLEIPFKINQVTFQGCWKPISSEAEMFSHMVVQAFLYFLHVSTFLLITRLLEGYSPCYQWALWTTLNPRQT